MIDFLLGVPGKLKTISAHLATYLSSTRCAKIDNLDAAISTRAASNTAVSNATYTSARAAYIDTLFAKGQPEASGIDLGTVAYLPTGDVTAFDNLAGLTVVDNSSGAPNTVLTYSGSGVIEFLAFVMRGYSPSYPRIKITIDGVVVLDYTHNAFTSVLVCPIGAMSFSVGATVKPVSLSEVPFLSSVLIETWATAGGTQRCAYKIRRAS